MINLIYAVLFTTLTAQAANTHTYTVSSSFEQQSCIGPATPDQYFETTLGPTDENGYCIDIPNKKCMEDEQYAVFPQGIRQDSICDALGDTPNCERLVLRPVVNEKTGTDDLYIERNSIRNYKATYTGSRQVPMEQVLDLPGRFVIPWDECNFVEIKYKFTLVK